MCYHFFVWDSGGHLCYRGKVDVLECYSNSLCNSSAFLICQLVVEEGVFIFLLKLQIFLDLFKLVAFLLTASKKFGPCFVCLCSVLLLRSEIFQIRFGLISPAAVLFIQLSCIWQIRLFQFCFSLKIRRRINLLTSCYMNPSALFFVRFFFFLKSCSGVVGFPHGLRCIPQMNHLEMLPSQWTRRYYSRSVLHNFVNTSAGLLRRLANSQLCFDLPNE